jgi:Site-specific DNA methylase
VKSPINWFGGKYYMAKKIIDLFPQHKTYVEVFGGAGHILFKKPYSEIEVFNDINSDLVTFFRVLRDKNKAQELQRLLELTPHSREEFIECYNSWESEKNEVERVRKWFVTLMQCFSKSFGNSGWSYSKTVSSRGMSQTTSQWLGKIENDLPAAVERLRTVQIENQDFREIIPRYDSPETLFYLDPPYIHETRKMTYTYAFEMKNSDHEELVDLLLKIKGKAILSGYDHPIYNKLLDNGWRKILLGEYDKKSMKHDAQTQKGKEYVWINYEVQCAKEVS